jgi:hypothetical protein
MKRLTSCPSIIPLLLISCQSLGLMAFLSRANTAHAYTRYNSCTSALSASAQKLDSFKNVNFVRRENRNSSYKISEGRPDNRPVDIMYVIDGKGIHTVMSSSKMLATLSENVIRNCSDVSTVTFGKDGTDYLVTFGVFQDASIRKFACGSRMGDGSVVSYGKVSCFGN